MVAALQIEVLGPPRLRRGGTEVPIASRRQRLLLSCLVAQTGPVAVDVLVEALWGRSGLPSHPTAALHTVVSRLRRLLAPDAHVRHEPAGYVLELSDSAAVDARRFDQLVTVAGETTDAAAVGCLREALGCWRGPAWAGVEDCAPIRGEALRLEDVRRTSTERLGSLLVAEGAAEEAVGWLRALVDEQPLRESATAGLMLALCHAGRRAEALEAFHAYRELLVEELGLDPSPAIVELHRRALTNELDQRLPPSPRPAPGPLRPPSSSPLVGRDRDLAELRQVVRSCRFVTVTGVGGVGKTRLVAEALPGLAVELGRRCVGIDCAGVVTSRDLTEAVAVAFGVRSTGPELVGRLAAACTTVPAVVVLDGAERMTSSAIDTVEELLARAPALRVVATSRVPTGSSHEQLLPLGTLPVAGADVARDGAGRLLTAAARRARPDFTVTAAERPVVADICRRLDGLPLALELAGARAATVGLEAVSDGLASGADVLDGGRPEGRRSLAAILAWTVEALHPDAARLLGHLAVARGPIDVPLAMALAPPSLAGRVVPALEELVRGALLVAVSGPPRPSYRLLGLIRHFAAAQLGDRERAATEDALCTWARQLADAAVHGALGPDDRQILDLVDRHAADLGRALTLTARADPDAAGVLAGRFGLISSHRLPPALFEPIWQFGRPRDGSRRPPLAVAAAARVATLRGDQLAGLELGRAAWRHAEQDVEARYLAAHTLAIANLYAGRPTDAAEWCRELVRCRDLSAAHHADAHATLALLATYADDLPTARQEAAAARHFASLAGAHAYRAFAAYAAGEVAIRAHDQVPAGALLREAIRSAIDAGAPFVEALARTALASLLVRDRAPGAGGVLRTALTYWQQVGAWPQIWTSVRLAAELSAQHGDHETTLLLLEAADHDPQSPQTTGRDAERDRRHRAAARAHLDGFTLDRLDELAQIVAPAAVVERALAVCAQPVLAAPSSPK